MTVASIIMAAGRGSRMKGYTGNKTLLPLIGQDTPFKGKNPILLHIINNLPTGPKAIVVNFRKEDIIEKTRDLEVTYCEQPHLNGTGGALIAAEKFIENSDCPYVIITMGDVPFIRDRTYQHLVEKLENTEMVILGFEPEDKKQYGVLSINCGHVEKIIEWKYWHTFSAEARSRFTVCNSGIYAARTETLGRYLRVLVENPQTVIKEIDGRSTRIEEFFITDIIEYMVNDGLSVTYVTTEDESEAMGIDDVTALEKAQAYFKGPGVRGQRSEIGHLTKDF
jgi:bifunctional UDP-N-acetylglucosamine pyrophosphorylase / glucosamine-1-phosphate N-acetyltransferase